MIKSTNAVSIIIPRLNPVSDRFVMPSLSLPAPSLRTANRLPAGGVLRLVSNYLIYIVLWSIRQAILRRRIEFSPCSQGGDGSLQPRAIAVDVIGGAGEAGAVAADDRDEGLVEPPAVGVGGGEAITCRRNAVAQPCKIDRGDPPVVDDEAAADHHARHRRAVLAMDELVDRVVERQPVGVVEVEHDDVGLIAGGDAADPAVEAKGAGAALGRRQCRLAGREPPPPIGALHLGDERGQ